ncbi:hypothetical protein DICVIV_05217 [Dictyocaulus viviparus]|uniref:Lipid-binding serum glycoprotein C-terminal domain-containing protein n=1 Tax=Dictyocaulus viviparus TaxID=29172 RepID=A0A0D8XVI9_DICVI|nr:hypothetical protein DICVIV_05217 [Dictyocaulus viviparus]
MERRVNQRLSLLTTRIALDDLHKFDLVKSFTTSKREFERNNNTRRMDMRRDSPLEHVLSSISQARRQQRFHKLSSKLNLFYRDSLTLDYSMLNTPVISERGVEMATSGEISSPGSRTPFGPPPFIQHPAVSSNLLQLVVSDYVPNTLMYHGHKIGIFNTRIDPSTPQFGQMMHTTCGMNSESLFCIGDLFPTLREIVCF